MLLGSNKYYGLNLKKETITTMRGFGGGMHREELCGALSGGVAAIGVILSEKKGCSQEDIRSATREFIHVFTEALNSTNCKDLKERYRQDLEKCSPVVGKAGEIVETVLNQYPSSDKS